MPKCSETCAAAAISPEKWVLGRDWVDGLMALRPPEPQGQVARVDIIEQRARALVRQVGIEAFGLEQRDAPFPGGTLRFERREFDRELVDLLVEVVPRLEPVIARVGVHSEIADQQRRPEIEAERGQE